LEFRKLERQVPYRHPGQVTTIRQTRSAGLLPLTLAGHDRTEATPSAASSLRARGASLAAVRLAVLLALALANSIQAAEFFVSPSGRDTDPGTRTQPFATLARAQQAARALAGQTAVTITLRNGTYYLPEPLVFTGADSGTGTAPVVYQAFAGEEPVLSGGLRLELKWEPFTNGIWRAALASSDLRAQASGLALDQLFVNGQRQPMARYPNYGPQAQYFQGYARDCSAPERVARWAQPAGGFLHAMHRSLWGDMHWQITGKRADHTLDLLGGWQNNRQMGAHAEYRFVEHIFEELDAPGEWFHDTHSNTLYYYPLPGLDLASATIEGVRLQQLVEFRGTRQAPARLITLRGLTFRHATRTFMDNKEPLLRSDWTTSRSGAIYFSESEDCTMRDCVIDQVGGNGVFVDGYNRRLAIVGCRIAEAGASAISFVGRPAALRSPLFEYHQTQTLAAMDPTPGPQTPDYPADCQVEDCLIYRTGRVEKQTAGVNIAMAEAITVRHCSIYDCPRAGINICDGAFGGHLIEFNDVFDTVKETGDHGSFNSWGRDRFWHPDRAVTAAWVREHPDMPRWDCRRPIVLRNNRWRCDHGWDIDLDDGSSHYELYNNLCLAGGIKLREGYFRQVSNNITVDWTFCPHVWYPDSHTTFTRNIVWEDRYRPAGMRSTDQSHGIDHNLVHQPGAAARPAMGLQQFGGDRHSLVADAQFVNPAAGDYRVQAGSPALSLGFTNFPMDQFGVRSPALRRLAKTPPLPGTLAAARIRSGGWDRKYSVPKTAVWLGATLKNLGDLAERSAVGLADPGGVLVVSVLADSVAARAGLRENDVIRACGGERVDNLEQLAQLDVAAEGSNPAPLILRVWRNQADLDVAIPRPAR